MGPGLTAGNPPETTTRMNAQKIYWPPALQVPALAGSRIHVWVWDLDLLVSEADWKILGPQEAIRARRFVYPQDRDRYVRAHAAMRMLLASYANSAPANIVFSENQYGKPQIPATHRAPLHFNLSHSAGTAVLAVSQHYDLGVDVEVVRPIHREVAEKHFSPHELRTLQTLPQEQWLDGFYRCWTSKEALLKGEGLGLNLPLDSFDVEVDPQRPPGLIAVRPPARIAPRWRLVELKPAHNTVGTLAVRDEMQTFVNETIECFSLSGQTHFE